MLFSLEELHQVWPGLPMGLLFLADISHLSCAANSAKQPHAYVSFDVFVCVSHCVIDCTRVPSPGHELLKCPK